MQYRKKWGWRCKTTSYQEDKISDVFWNVKMKLLWVVSEKSKKISTLQKYYVPSAHPLMAITAESEHANSMTSIMDVHIKEK